MKSLFQRLIECERSYIEVILCGQSITERIEAERRRDAERCKRLSKEARGEREA